MKAAKAENLDMTTGSIFKKLLLFALPIMAGNLLQELYNVADTLIVGRTLGVTRLAAVGATGALSFLVLGFIMGLTGGCAVVTSQYYGAGDETAVKKSVAAHAVICVACAAVFTAVFTLSVRALLALLHTPEESALYAWRYLSLIYSGLTAPVLYNFLAASLRAVGNSKTPLLMLAVSSLLNIGLDLLFILAFGWDVAGAAIATIAAQLISGLLCAAYVVRRVPLLLPRRESWQSLGGLIVRELKIGVPMGFQFSVIALGLVILQYVLNGFGESAVAAYTVGGKIQSLCQNPIVALGTVTATFVGQNAGAKQTQRIKKGVGQCLLAAVSLSVLIGAAVLLLARPVTLLFVDAAEEAVIRQVGEYLSWWCPLLWPLGFLHVCRGALQGLGDGLIPMVGSALELVVRAAIPLLCGSALGYTAICIAGPAACLACAVLVTLTYMIRIRRIKS